MFFQNPHADRLAQVADEEHEFALVQVYPAASLAHPPAVPTNLHVRAAISKVLPISKLIVTKNGLLRVNL
jgi:hypothetical protein